MAKTIRIDMNIGEPELTLKRVKKAIAKDTAMGLSSPMIGFLDMAALAAKAANAEALRIEADLRKSVFQSKYNQAEVLAGSGAGQTKNTTGTIYYGAVQVRSLLLVKYRGTEEQLSEWGYNVVITTAGARKNVRVDIPYKSPEKMIELGQAIINKDTAMGAGSPLTGNFDMAAFAPLVTDAAALLAEWDTAKSEAQSLHNQAIVIIGYGAGQTKDTPGTIYCDRCTMRERLLQKYQGMEEILSEWGYDIVIGRHNAKHKGNGNGGGTLQSVTLEDNVVIGNIKEIVTNNFTVTPSSTVAIETSGSEAVISAAETAGGMVGPVQLHVYPGIPQNKTAEAFGTSIGLDATHTHIMIQCLGASAHYKITFNNVMVAAASS